ncbi:phage tail protein [Clostridium tertium]|uniref:phage tail spike protein n=1 Tax=Clostridium tertium TaxID=1559 RepID=UPI002330FE69|nr:phage tail spike protein [Clostridium tertium]MDB1943748.1 phage tail protein [Clostridium tertium]MDB1951086.1 phage tail protein [Clostridium tertium]
MLQLYDKNKNKIKGLTKYKDFCIESVLKTGDKTLSFLYPSKFIDGIVEEGYIRNKTDEFVIKEIADHGEWTSIKAQMNVEDLEGKAWEHFNTTEQTIENCLNLACAGTGWTVQVNNVSKKRTVKKTNCSSWDLIQEAKKIYRVEIEFDTLNKVVKVYEKLGQDKGVYFSDEINLKALDIESNSYDFYTKIIAIGKENIKVEVENFQYSNKVKTLIWKDERYTVLENLREDAIAKLQELSKPRKSYSADVIDLANLNPKYKNILDYKLGDTITLISKDKKIREKQRIVKITDYPDEAERNSCEIANTTLDFIDIQKEFQDTADTVNNITEDNGTVSQEAIKVAVKSLVIDKADIGSLNAAVARIGSLETTKANITDLTAINANISNLQANKANITDLTATNIKFDVAEGGTLSLQTLLSKFITGENGQFLNLTTDNVVIANAVIKDTIAANISVQDLKAGNIDANRFNIVGTNGNLLIKDNTIQIKDSTRVRVQIGKDASNDYSMYVWDATGKLMFDATGLKADGIKSKIIRDDMVSDTANISGSKINISSLITEVNKDTNTQLIKASKVAVDLTGQSLEVSFNSLKSNVDSKESRNLISNNNWETGSVNEGLSSGKLYNELKINTNLRLRIKELIEAKSKQITLSFDNNEFKVFLLFFDENKAYLGRTEGSIGWINATPYILNKDIKYLAVSIAKKDDSKINIEDIVKANIKVEIGGNSNPVYSIAPEDIDQKIKANTTSIEAVRGSIATLISDTTIEKNGTTTKLKDAYSTLEQTVSGINSTVASNTSSISSVNSLADSKAKVFTSTPTTPYKVGDLWVQGAVGDVMKCKVTRASGAYVSTDWEKASKYTDDAKANAVEGNLNTLSGKVTTVESNYASLSQNLEGFKTTVASTYSTKIELSIVDGKVSNLTSRVSTAESSITQLNNKIVLKVEATDITNAINNVQIGGRNLAPSTDFGNESFWYWYSATGKATKVIIDEPTALSKKAIQYTWTVAGSSGGYYRNLDLLSKLEAGTSYTVSAWIKCSNTSAINIAFEGRSPSATVTPIADTWTFVSFTFTENGATNTAIHFYYNASQDVGTTLSIHSLKVEKGNKATDWTPAPEDVDSAITTVDGRVTTLNTSLTTTNNKVATIETNLNSITSRVSSTESSITTINGNVTSLQSRMSTAESKITDSAIVSTVRSSTAYTTDLNAKANQSALNTTNSNVSGLTTRINTVEQSITATAITTTISSAINAGTSSITTTQFVMDKTGFTVKNGAIKIQNKAGTNVLTSDTNGNLTITGTFVNKNSNGTDAIKIDNTNIYFYDWERNGRNLGIIYSSYNSAYPNVRGFSLGHSKLGYMTIGYESATNTYNQYITFDKYSINPSYTAPIRVHESAVFNSAVNMQDRVYIPNTLCFDSNYSATTPQIFKNASDSRNILTVQVSVNAKNDGFFIQSNTGSKLISIEAGYTYPINLNNNVQINGNYTATGSKNSLQYTEHYGKRLINAYETAEYYFGDIGSGIVKNGECIIWIDEIFQECINTDVEYHIFTQIYNGTITKIERYKNYFIVYGKDNTEFSWELKAKRIGYENIRLDNPDIEGYLDNSPVFTEEDLKNCTSEDVLLQELDFKLEDILMEEI